MVKISELKTADEVRAGDMQGLESMALSLS